MKNLNKVMYLLLVEKRIDNFSVSELVETYMHLYSSSKNELKARVFIHRQLYRLVNQGYLLKHGKKNTHKIKYTLTEKFKQKFCNLSNPKAKGYFITEEEVKAALKNRLKEYECNLLISTSEMEEYENFMEEYPAIMAILRRKFELANEEKYRYLGRITAVKKILSECNIVKSREIFFYNPRPIFNEI